MNFSPGRVNKVGDRTYMEYVVAADYDDTLVAIEAKNAETKYQLQIERVDGPLSRADTDMQGYNTTDFLWYNIDVSENFRQGETDFSLAVVEYHKRRREAFPERLALTE